MEQITAWAAAHPLLAVIGYAVASALLNLLIAERSRVDAWCERHPRLAALLKIMRALSIDPWHLVAAASLFVNKQLPAASKRVASLPRIPPAQLLVLALLLGGCTGSLEQSRAAGASARKFGLQGAGAGTPERCASLDDRRQIAGMVGKSAAVLAGATGLAAIPTDDPDQRDLRVGLAIGSAATAAVAAGAMFVAEAAGESWARECSK